MSETTLYLVIKGTGTDSDGVSTTTKTFTIPNPVAEAKFKADDANAFFEQYNSVYGTAIYLTHAYYEERKRRYVYPEA